MKKRETLDPNEMIEVSLGDILEFDVPELKSRLKFILENEKTTNHEVLDLPLVN
jgi:hypothetical protein